MKNLADLQAECAALGIEVGAKGRASKEPYVAALRDHHWRRDHPNEPLPAQVSPMLLASWDDLDEAEAREIEQDCHAWVVQPKLDGVRALFHIEGGRVRITSRVVSEVTYRLSEFQDNLSHLTEGLEALDGTILDGELLCPLSVIDTGSTVTASSLQATTAILATTPDNARKIQGQNAQVRFHAFDILRHRGRDLTPLPWVDRQHFLEKSGRELKNSYFETVPSFVVNKPDVHRRIVATGGEGTVWKRADQPYEPGRRVKHWVKRKRKIEIEAFVSGFKPGTNGHASLVGAIEFGIRQQDGSTVPVGWVSSWSEQERQAMTLRGTDGVVRLNPDFLNRKAVLVGQEESAKSRRLRHARLKRWGA